MTKSIQSDSGGWPRLSPWVLRIPAATVLAVILAFQFGRITGFGSALMYTASWMILLHVLIGEYVFIRTLHAVSRNQQVLDDRHPPYLPAGGAGSTAVRSVG